MNGQLKNLRLILNHTQPFQSFVTVSGLDHEPTPKEMAQIFVDNEMQVVGPPLKID